jgi:hypothetical protein
VTREDDQYTPDELKPRCTEVLRRMLATPPQQHAKAYAYDLPVEDDRNNFIPLFDRSVVFFDSSAVAPVRYAEFDFC